MTPAQTSKPSRTWAPSTCLPFATALLLPTLSIGYSSTAPHPWYVAACALVVLPLFELLDHVSGSNRRLPVVAPGWICDAILYAAAALQCAGVVALARSVTAGSLLSTGSLVAIELTGASSTLCGIIAAHELIHRARPLQRSLGRLLLCTVLYEHFFTEHIRGHHARVGTDEDGATARFGESYRAFLRRTVPQQFRSALKLERERLEANGPRSGIARWFRNRVVQGLVAEGILATTILVAFGWAGLLAFLLQAFMAVCLLETVNYIEHWGLRRTGKRLTPSDAWDSEGRFSYWCLFGLTRHADHHLHAARPYQELRVHDESPKLPEGYVRMVLMAQLRNTRFQELLTAELRRRRLGPFAEGSRG